LPCKVLDAPALQDDYYLNLIDWSTQNFLAVGLASSVYLWNANNSKVTKLCDLGISDSATSVSWALKGPQLGLGTNSGEVQIWDVNKMKRVRILQGHTNRVGAIAWNSNIVSTGSRDKTILHRDLRQNSSFINKLVGHKQ
jgi:cell division cycle 20-like protein 1 (cofactor of APC complex)